MGASGGIGNETVARTFVASLAGGGQEAWATQFGQPVTLRRPKFWNCTSTHYTTSTHDLLDLPILANPHSTRALKMLSRTVFRASRASQQLSSPLRRATAATPLVRASAAAMPSRIGARWYSEETKKDEKKEGSEKSEVDVCKEQLEAKNKEVTDLKVR